MKKLRYIPGMFSIILLPILGIWHMNKHNYFQQLTAIEFYVPESAKMERINEEYEHITASNILENRIYKEVILDGDNSPINTFDYIDQFVNSTIQTKDTIYGLKIHFEKNATYNEFIEVLNIFSEREATTYTLNDKTIYFVGRDWRPPSPDDEILEPLPMFYCSSGISDFEPKFNLQQFVQNLKSQFLQSKIIYSAYFIFVFVALTYLIKRKST